LFIQLTLLYLHFLMFKQRHKWLLCIFVAQVLLIIVF